MEKYNLEQTGQQVQNILNESTPQSELTAETERAQLAEQQLQNDIDAIEEKIPSGASSSNKLATEEYVDDSTSTATATFRGTFNLVSDLGLTVDATEQQIAAALASEISTADNNDYCFVQIPTSDETPSEIEEIDRYKFNGTAWAFEYALNNSGFTAAEWAAINSGITSELVTKLGNLPTAAALAEALAGKQNVLTFDNVPTENSNNPVKSSGVYSAIDDEKGARINSDNALQQAIDGINGKIPSDASSENKLATASDVDDEATARSNADQSLQDAIEAILLLIPTAASSLNQLADKAFVNSSIATNTATFRGTFNLVNDLHLTLAATHAQVGNALALAILDSDNNDYCFVQIPTVETAPNEIAQTDRYKFNGTSWEYEYTLNNSGFTSAQWIAINSGITSVLVSKLSELPTNSELTSELGTLSAAITAINQKIPSAAAQNNKLVDTAALESYIVQVLNVLTISYNVTSTDGHVTFHIEQVDGKITSVTLATSDIASAAALNLKASQADLTALEGRVTTAEGNITSIGGRVSTNETDIANLQDAYAGLTQSDIIIGSLPGSGVRNKIYRVPGTNSYSDYMWNGSTWVLMATYNNAIDPRPKKGSTNLVESGGVFDNMGALDISELNATENPHTLATYADLSAALAAIPSNDYKKGGMSIKFVCSSDNNYVQYRLTDNLFTIDTTKWLNEDAGVQVYTSSSSPQLSLEDENMNTIAEFEDGDFRTKNFNSAKCPSEKQDNTSSQLNIQDESGNNVAQFVDGDIRTKNFDSKKIRLPLNNKKISIVGDSISTFSGYLVSDKAGYQYSAYETKYPYQDIQSVEQTWWKQLLNETGAKLGNLCAWSGSYVEGFSTFTDSAFYACSDRRILDIGFDGVNPDIIIVLIGINDYGVVNCQIGDFTDKSTIPSEGDQNTFSNAYGLMIKKIISQYPNSKIFCCTILDVKNGYSTVDDTTYPELNNKGVSIYDMNQTIKKISDIFGCHLIDLHSCGISYFNSSLYLPDGLHPNAAGAKLIKNCVKKALLNSL